MLGGADRRRPAPAAARRTRRPGTPRSRSCGPIRRYGRATPSRRTASAAWPAGITKALGRARRLVYLEDQYLWSADIARVLAAALRRSPELHLIAVVPRHSDLDGRWTLQPPNQVGRHQALSRSCAHGGGGPGARLRPREPRGIPRLRAREGLRHRRHVGVRRLATTSTAGPGPTTANCPAAVLDADARRPRARRPRRPRRRGPPLRPRPAPGAGARAPRPRRRRRRRPLDPARFVRPAEEPARRICDAWHARRAPRGPAAGRLRAHRPERTGAHAHAAWAAPLTASSTTRTGARCGCAVAPSSERAGSSACTRSCRYVARLATMANANERHLVERARQRGFCGSGRLADRRHVEVGHPHRRHRARG